MGIRKSDGQDRHLCCLMDAGSALQSLWASGVLVVPCPLQSLLGTRLLQGEQLSLFLNNFFFFFQSIGLCLRQESVLEAWVAGLRYVQQVLTVTEGDLGVIIRCRCHRVEIL